jgi:hypothetical protein
MGKLTRLVIFAAAAGAAAAGVYYYMQKKETETGAKSDEAEDFDDDLDANGKKRTYVNLNLDNVDAALSKAKEKIADSYNYVKDSVKAGFEGATGGTREFVDLADEDVVYSNVDDSENSENAAIIRDAEEKLTDAANEGATKVENFFDEEE